MRFIGIVKKGGKRQIKYKKEDETISSKPAPDAVCDFAKKTLKEGESFYAEWSADFKQITRVTKSNPKKKSYSGKGYNNYKDSRSIDSQSAVKSASTALTAIKGVDTDNYADIYGKLIEVGLKYIKNDVKKAVEAKGEEKEEMEEVEVDDEPEE